MVLGKNDILNAFIPDLISMKLYGCLWGGSPDRGHVRAYNVHWIMYDFVCHTESALDLLNCSLSHPRTTLYKAEVPQHQMKQEHHSVHYIPV